ncbi:hypothetical protein Taro_015474 [Colocasia esculenta]|uniref:Uncharacterized protein n=1 Tax=Colocasia esculenta TaxID=4460 RepID=A0A843ULD2_COLES|nr:hypothetical protein [Colocasia esculenta]
MRSHRQPATALPERNLGAVPEILRMRPFTDRVEVPILNWGLAGGSDPRRCPYAIASAACDRAPREEIWRRTGNL